MGYSLCSQKLSVPRKKITVLDSQYDPTDYISSFGWYLKYFYFQTPNKQDAHIVLYGKVKYARCEL